MARRKGMSKKELRAPDEFQSFVLELTEKYGNYWKIAVVVLLLIIVIPLGISGYKYYKNKQENNAANKFYVLSSQIKSLNYQQKIEKLNGFLNEYQGSNAAFQAMLLKGRILFANKDYNQAMEVFQTLIDKAPIEELKIQGKLDLALAILKLGKKDEALGILLKLTENDITAADAAYYLAMIYEKEGNILKAKSFYQEIVDKYKDYPYVEIAKLKLETI